MTCVYVYEHEDVCEGVVVVVRRVTEVVVVNQESRGFLRR